jgi:hypothetical protein
VIDGNQNGSFVIFESGEDSTAVLRGFSIINGLGAGLVPTSEQPFDFTMHYTGYGESYREK